MRSACVAVSDARSTFASSPSRIGISPEPTHVSCTTILTPPPTPEEVEQRRLERIYRAAVTPPRAPDKRERRTLRRLRGRD